MSDVVNAVRAALPGVRADLEALVKIPAIAFDGLDHEPVRQGADAVQRLLDEAGAAESRQLSHGGGQPSVYAHFPAPAGQPTVLLYAHQDVQPVGDLAKWEQDDPFTVVEKDGRLYGRGVADDKAGVMAHVAALRAFGGRPPVGVKLLIEGEEEFGSPTLEGLIRANQDLLAADVVVIADSTNWRTEVPALTTTLRGVINVYVEVALLKVAVHSGVFGGPVPDALTALARLVATMHDDAGDVAVEGLVSGPSAPLDFDEEALRHEAGLLPGTEFIGTGRLTERLWTKPTATVLGIDAPGAAESANALQPSARAKVSFRLAPGDSAERALKAVRAHFEAHAPWGAQVTVTPEGGLGDPCAIDATGPSFDAARAAFAEAWDGTEPVEIGIGGSIPMIATFQELYPEAAILVTGVEDQYSNPHGPNESLDIEMFERVCTAEALLLDKLKR
ncbi:M20/M25/M40 family metallo-hydrolase [Glycomyces scopariae]|uniref:Acetylornithine deacetylase/Succinyl-diaminopimelate desuccinylase n=1 Tax=Glycomyces sambucus TaxID=380244 RepID=A0A1G9LLP1_9ACTN|nr:dipeptidase [Glycomyces sambucus]SDL62445.1 Acetylornithine deacetylase/Succinyl-diaminopimelate desuccinylase [Glycomyces sambucus]